MTAMECAAREPPCSPSDPAIPPGSGRSFGRLLASGSPGHRQNLDQPSQRSVQSQRNKQQLQIVAFVGQSASGVPYALRLQRNTILHRQIIRSKYYVPKGELDAVIAG